MRGTACYSEIMRWLIGILCVVTFTQCGRVENHVITRDVNVNSWDERVDIEFEHGRKREMCDLDLVLHVNRTFDQREVAFEITLFTPDSLRYSESVASEVAVEWGPTARYYTDVTIGYRHDVALDHEGLYRVAIRPLQPLTGVESAGINLRMK